MINEVILLDDSLPEVSILIDGLKDGVAVYRVTETSSPKDLLLSLLHSTDQNRLHLLGHGRPGEIILGKFVLDSESLDSIRCPLRENLEIYLWSCQTAGGDKGRHFLQKFADITGAKVFASANLVGHPQKDAEWSLTDCAIPSLFSVKNN